MEREIAERREWQGLILKKLQIGITCALLVCEVILLLMLNNKWGFLAACSAPILSLTVFILSIKSYLDRGFEMGLFSGGTYFSLIGWHMPTIKEKLAIFYSTVHMISAVIDFARVVLGYGSHSAFPIAVAYLAIFCSISDLTVEVLDHRVS